MLKVSIQFTIVLCLLSCVNISLAQSILTLEDAIRIGLENNYAIKIAQNDQQIITNDATYGNAGFLPVLDAIANRNFSVEDAEQRFLEGPTRVIDNARSNVINASVNLNWTIFNGLGMFITLERLQELQKAGELNARIVVENTIAQISNNYYRLVLETERLRVFDNTMELSEQRLNIAQALYEVGTASKVEYLAAQVDYNADKSLLIQQQQILYDAKVDLNRLMGLGRDTNFSVIDKIIFAENLQLENLRQNLLISNSNLLFARKNRAIAELEMRELKAQRFPELSVGGGYEYNDLNAQAGFLLQNRSTGFNYGLTATFNIFDGFNQTRQIQNARIIMETSELQYQDLELQIDSELRKVFQSYNNSLVLLELENSNLEIARENAAIALDRYRLGRSTPLELREAQRNEVDAESRAINASYAIKIAEIEILRLTGNILETMNVN